MLKGLDRRRATGVGTTALVFAIINVALRSRRRCCSRRAPIRTSSIWPAWAALYAAVDMNSLQWVQGRPAPILTDTLDGVGLVRQLLQHKAPTRTRG